MAWGDRDVLLAAAVNEQRWANYLTQVINTEEKKRKGIPEPELIRPPGDAPGPKRKPRRGRPLSVDQIRRAGGDIEGG